MIIEYYNSRYHVNGKLLPRKDEVCLLDFLEVFLLCPYRVFDDYPGRVTKLKYLSGVHRVFHYRRDTGEFVEADSEFLELLEQATALRLNSYEISAKKTGFEAISAVDATFNFLSGNDCKTLKTVAYIEALDEIEWEIFYNMFMYRIVQTYPVIDFSRLLKKNMVRGIEMLKETGIMDTILGSIAMEML